ncbi:sulfotransferase family 2 domain-containing protein [Thioclava sp.]|uniref:sulfotransferase family 2 domain-containing protein n=1 Tax=Thioclava sp. TaxID=1933450 RepID=UPI003AA97898
MLVDHRAKLVSVSVPKTGSTSIHHSLKKALGANNETKSKLAPVYHLNAEDIRKIMGPHKFDSYFSFGVTRNPFDRMVSLFHDFHDQRGLIKASTFEDFILNRFDEKWSQQIHFLPQSFFLHSASGQVTSEAYRFEDGLENILGKIVDRLDLKNVEIGHARKSARKKWQDYYSNTKTAEVVRTVYASDFEAFNYPTEVQ